MQDLHAQVFNICEHHDCDNSYSAATEIVKAFKGHNLPPKHPVDIRLINKISKNFSDCHIDGMRVKTLSESDVLDYQKQSCDMSEFEYELVDQYSIGDSGDSFEGTIALPLGGNEFFMFQFSM